VEEIIEKGTIMDDFLKKMFIDEAKPALNRHSGNGGTGGGGSDEIYIPLWYESIASNVVLDLSNSTFNNPDQIPIYEQSINVLDEEAPPSSITPSSDDISLEMIMMSNGHFDTGSNIGSLYVNIMDASEVEVTGTIKMYYVKLKDLVGKQVPYIGNVLITKSDESHNNFGMWLLFDGACVERVGDYISAYGSSYSAVTSPGQNIYWHLDIGQIFVKE
jgi:hypothetical protein